MAGSLLDIVNRARKAVALVLDCREESGALLSKHVSPWLVRKAEFGEATLFSQNTLHIEMMSKPLE